MFKNFLENFKKLPLSNKSMIYLNWINSAWSIVSWFFVNIYVFNIQKSMIDVINYNIIFFTFWLLGFSLLWTLMSIFRQNIKNMYYIWYVLFIIAFLSLFILSGTMAWVYIFSCIFAFWTWAFWCAVHTQELKNIEDINRDFYSSSISAGKNVILIIMPLLIGTVFFLWEIFKFDWYKVLFLTLPVIYLSSFLFIKNIDTYIPKKIRKKDFKNFFNMKKYKYWHMYFAVSGFILALANFLMPVLNIYFLRNEVNVSLFQAILTFISTTLIVHLSHKRNHENRLRHFLIICVLFAINFIFLGLFLWILSFLVFSLANLFLSPLFRVSEHVYDLSLMDNIKTDHSDFFPAMILREIILWIWRIFILLVILFFIYIWETTTENILKIWIFLSEISYLLIVICIYFWEKYEKNVL